MARFDVIAFDADDTLWHNEHLFIAAQVEFRRILAHYHSPDWIDAQLYQTEARNLQHFGYGIKGFALSMIETAVELTGGQVTGQEIMALVQVAKEMLAADVELLEHVQSVVQQLASAYPLMLISKGDLLDQQNKVARSGLAPFFGQIEIVSEKSRASYAALLQRHKIEPERFLMVGNSLRSDILPVLELGGWAVYVPYPSTWMHEVDEPPPVGTPRYAVIEHLGLLPELLKKIEGVSGQ